MVKWEDLCRWLSLALGLVMAFTWAAGQQHFAAVCGQVRADSLRLHIVAAGDTVAQQSLKLRVRDAVLAESRRLCAGARTQAEARQRLACQLPAIRAAVRRVLTAAGQPMPIRAELTQGWFATSRYPGRTLPAGQYTALRITLGAGRGHNWWCCLYPSLCLSAAGSRYDTPAENELVTAGGYTVRFALVEWWEKLRAGAAA